MTNSARLRLFAVSSRFYLLNMLGTKQSLSKQKVTLLLFQIHVQADLNIVRAN